MTPLAPYHTADPYDIDHYFTDEYRIHPEQIPEVNEQLQPQPVFNTAPIPMPPQLFSPYQAGSSHWTYQHQHPLPLNNAREIRKRELAVQNAERLQNFATWVRNKTPFTLAQDPFQNGLTGHPVEHSQNFSPLEVEEQINEHKQGAVLNITSPAPSQNNVHLEASTSQVTKIKSKASMYRRRWTKIQIANLKTKKELGLDWQTIASELQRTPLACRKRWAIVRP